MEGVPAEGYDGGPGGDAASQYGLPRLPVWVARQRDAALAAVYAALGQGGLQVEPIA